MPGCAVAAVRNEDPDSAPSEAGGDANAAVVGRAAEAPEIRLTLTRGGCLLIMRITGNKMLVSANRLTPTPRAIFFLRP